MNRREMLSGLAAIGMADSAVGGVVGIAARATSARVVRPVASMDIGAVGVLAYYHPQPASVMPAYGQAIRDAWSGMDAWEASIRFHVACGRTRAEAEALPLLVILRPLWQGGVL